MGATKHTKLQKQVLTAILAFTFFTYGFNGALFGPTNEELAAVFNVDQKTVSYGLTMWAGMKCVGALFFAWAFNMFHRQRQFIVQVLGTGICALLIPFMTSNTQYVIAEAIGGFLSGGILTLLNVLVLEMWRENSNPYMQAVHFVYALGNMAGPLVCAQFAPKNANIHGQSNNTQAAVVSTSTGNSLITYPYLTAGALLVTATIVVCLYEILHPYERPKRGIHEKKDSSQKKTVSNLKFVIFVLCSALSFGLFLNIDTVTGAYLVTFLEKGGLNFTIDKAIYLQTVTNLSYAVARIFCIFISAKLKPLYLIGICLIGILASNTILYLYHESSEVVVIIALVLFGATLSPVYPSLHAFVEQHIDETNVVGAIFTIVGLLPVAVTPLIISSGMQAHPVILIYSNLGCTLALMFVFTLASYLALQHFTVPKPMNIVTVKYDKDESNF